MTFTGRSRAAHLRPRWQAAAPLSTAHQRVAPEDAYQVSARSDLASITSATPPTSSAATMQGRAATDSRRVSTPQATYNLLANQSKYPV